MADIPTYRYPAEIIDPTTDWFSVQAYDYDAESGTIGIQTGSLFSSGKKSLKGNIILPIPSNIQDGNSVSYGEDKLNTITGAAVGGIKNVMDFDLGNIPTSLANAKEAIKTAINQSGLDLDTAGGLIKKTLAAEAVSIFGGNTSIESLLAREQGRIFNPNLELLFNGVTLRSFRFSFKMTPRDDKESDEIKNIIRFLKQKMAARTDTKTFLQTPHIFELSYKKGRDNHPFLHSFKPCFLKDMSVNYTGENVYATYSDGTPISLIMDLTFQETEPVYENDYNEYDNNAKNSNYLGVGY